MAAALVKFRENADQPHRPRNAHSAPRKPSAPSAAVASKRWRRPSVTNSRPACRRCAIAPSACMGDAGSLEASVRRGQLQRPHCDRCNGRRQLERPDHCGSHDGTQRIDPGDRDTHVGIRPFRRDGRPRKARLRAPPRRSLPMLPAASTKSSLSSAMSLNRPTCWRSTPRSRPPAPVKWAAALPSSPAK